MAGGKREGSGRIALPESEKKHGHKIYVHDSLKEEINSYGEGTSFSEKCAFC